MGLLFRKRLGLGPLALNFSKSGVGISAGVRGFRFGLTSSGRRFVSAGLPGTGVYYRKYVKKQSHMRLVEATPVRLGPMHPHSVGYALGYAFGWLLILSPLILLVIFLAALAR